MKTEQNKTLELFEKELEGHLSALTRIDSMSGAKKEIGVLLGKAKLIHATAVIRHIEKSLDGMTEENWKNRVDTLVRNLSPKQDSILSLFYSEVETQTKILVDGILEIEKKGAHPETIDKLMRAAHSLKGAARALEFSSLVKLAHAIEDVFSKGEGSDPKLIDLLFLATDFLSYLLTISPSNLKETITEKNSQVLELAEAISHFSPEQVGVSEKMQAIIDERPKKSGSDRFLRVGSENLNHLMGIAGEMLIDALWLEPFASALFQLRQSQKEIAKVLEMLGPSLRGEENEEKRLSLFKTLQLLAVQTRENLDHKISDLELFIRRHTSVSERLYGEVIGIRMRPFSDILGAYPRLVRDVSSELGKKVRLVIEGEDTPVDRDILEKLETPLNHLIRNSLDHGIESIREREEKGKPAEGTIKIEAYHRSGMLFVVVTDDGRGVDPEAIRAKIIDKKLSPREMATQLTESELMEFLFLPGFTTSLAVTEISGRGVGLNAVQTMVQEVGGTIRVFNRPGVSLSFIMQLPLTLSVIRALLVSIGGEPYAFPLARIDKSMVVKRDLLHTLDRKTYLRLDESNIGLVEGKELFYNERQTNPPDSLSIVILNERLNRYGVVVDAFIGEKDLVVQEIDPIIGKIPCCSAGAFTEDGSPLLIVDVDDMILTVDKMFLSRGSWTAPSELIQAKAKEVKRILVVEDSNTVREVVSRVLREAGYEIETAVDGVDGWNALRLGKFDLIITDVDMPRMGGVELIEKIRGDGRFAHLPVLIVSYKDRRADVERGLQAGANRYLTKSSFQDEELLQAVREFAGETG